MAIEKSTLYRDGGGSLVTTDWVDHPDDGMVRFFPDGGGFMQTMPAEEFRRTFSPYHGEPEYELKEVGGDFFEAELLMKNPIRAYVSDRRWNGWVMPYFDFETAKRLMKHLPELEYDEVKDVFSAPSYDDEKDEWGSNIIEVDGKSIKTYPIGAGGWCWELWEEPA